MGVSLLRTAQSLLTGRTILAGKGLVSGIASFHSLWVTCLIAIFNECAEV